MKKLQKQFDDCVMQYIQEFEKKHDVEFEYWVGDEVGGIVILNDYYFNFLDIKRDIDTNQPKELIFKWYEEGVEYAMNNKKTKHINYSSYISGLRYSDLDKPKTLIIDSQIDDIVNEFNKYLESISK